jgi:Flp pilus assembly pilin Flp
MRLLKRLWADDRGAIISVEFILIVAVLVFGLIPGLVALRNSTNAMMATLGNLILAVVPSFTFSGFAITANGNTIAQIGGVQFTPDTNLVLTSSQVAPTELDPTLYQVDPAP